jgi:hypothetical protein
MAWSELLAAVALVLVLEGVLPFLSPAVVRRMLARVAELGDRELRIGGFLSMLAGLILLLVARS